MYSSCRRSRERNSRSPTFSYKEHPKKYIDCVKAMEMVCGILGSTEGRRPAPTIIVGDEGTYRFLRSFRMENPEEKAWIREFPGEWHIMLHGAAGRAGRDS